MSLKTQARRLIGIAVLSSVLSTWGAGFGNAKDPRIPLKDYPHRRYSIAEAWIVPESKLAVANRCGSISVIDLHEKKVVEEILVGQRLADVKAHPRGNGLFAVDEGAHELIHLVPSGDSLRVAGRHRVSPYPVSLAISPGGNHLAVASLWSRYVTLFSLAHSPSTDIELRKIVGFTLSFNPDSVWSLEDGTEFAVADAFGDGQARIGISPPRLIADTGPHFVNRSSSYFPRWMLMPSVESYLVSADDHSSYLEQLRSYGGMKISLGPSPSPTPAERGEDLFRRFPSAGETCEKCHRNGHTTYQLADLLRFLRSL